MPEKEIHVVESANSVDPDEAAHNLLISSLLGKTTNSAGMARIANPV